MRGESANPKTAGSAIAGTANAMALSLGCYALVGIWSLFWLPS